MLQVTPTYENTTRPDGTPIIKDPTSNYAPDKETQDVITMVQNDCAIADLVRKHTYPEFNWNGFNEDLISYMNEMQKRFNSTPPAPSDDPDDEWKSNHVQPMTRNKVIAIVASITNAIMKPKASAINDKNEEDTQAALVMEDLITSTFPSTNYDDLFPLAVQEMCVNPGVIIQQDYTHIKRKVKVLTPSTSPDEAPAYTEKEVTDHTLSGFKMELVPLDEFYISNFYEPDIQKQDFIIRRKILTYDQAYLNAKDRDGFIKYVQMGMRIYFDNNTNLFFHQQDDFLDGRLVYMDTYYNRQKDLQLTFFNGWLDGQPDAPYHRSKTPLNRVDKNYPFASSGYERYNSRSFYYMPLTAKLALVQDEMDILHRALTDGTILSIFPPLNVIGAEMEETASIKPGALNSFSRPDSQVQPMNLGGNLQSGYQLLQDQKRVSDESSQSPQAAGLAQGGRQTLGEVQLLQQNTQIQLGLIGKMIAKLVKGYGDLLVPSILQHMTVGTVLDSVGSLPKYQYNTFIIPEVERMGDKRTSIVDFNAPQPTSKDTEMEQSYKLLKLEKKKTQTIYQVNPDSFRNTKFTLFVEPALEDRTASFSKRIFAFDRMKNSPQIDQEANLKYNLIEPLYPGESSRFIKDKETMQMEQQLAQGSQPTGNPVGRPPNPPMDPTQSPEMPL
jgi:hypothetical protein